jgi:hypothetical protein
LNDWDSEVVYNALAEIDENPQPEGEWRYRRICAEASDSEWVPDYHFSFIDNGQLVSGSYWLSPQKEDPVELVWIDRIEAPIPRPTGF